MRMPCRLLICTPIRCENYWFAKRVGLRQYTQRVRIVRVEWKPRWRIYLDALRFTVPRPRDMQVLAWA